MKTYKEKHVYVDDSSLEDEDWMTLRKIMRQISCCEVDEGELEGIRREIIGMAKEARVRGRSLREEIGESERTFAEEIFRASTGREMAPGRKQLKGVGIFFIVYGIVYLVHWGIRFLFFGMLNLMESYQGGGLDNFEQMRPKKAEETEDSRNLSACVLWSDSDRNTDRLCGVVGRGMDCS